MLSKVFLLGLALANFILIWSHQRSQRGPSISMCAFCPWYDSWSFTNEPTILLLATILLLFNRRWNYLASCALSGYVVGYISFYLLRSISHFGLFELWEGLPKAEPSIFLVWEFQIVLATLILIASVFYLFNSTRPELKPAG